VLLLDEPLGALDLKLRKEMQLELKALQREVGITFVYVTHDQEEALTMSDVIVVMRDGLIQQLGGPTELYERPVNRFVADFIGSSNFMAGKVEAIEPAAGHVVVRSDRGLALRGWVTDPAASPSVGQEVTVVTRPERLEVLTRDTDVTAAGWTAVPGRIHQGTYLGDTTEFRVETEGAGDLIVRRQNAAGAGSGQGMGPGDPVVVRWREEANLVLVS
jgi:spermidine/putrescine transport system ATP-binding protein